MCLPSPSASTPGCRGRLGVHRFSSTPQTDRICLSVCHSPLILNYGAAGCALNLYSFSRHPPSTMRYAILVWCWWCGFF